MTNAVKAYLLSVTASSLLLSVVQSLLPKGAVKQVAVLCGSLLVLLSVLSPVAKLDYEEIAASVSELAIQAETAQTGITVRNREIMAEIIKQQCESYILDKAMSLGASVAAEVQITQGASYPYPESVTVSGNVSAAQQQSLMKWIEEDLGIPKDRQEWKP